MLVAESVADTARRRVAEGSACDVVLVAECTASGRPVATLEGRVDLTETLAVRDRGADRAARVADARTLRAAGLTDEGVARATARAGDERVADERLAAVRDRCAHREVVAGAPLRDRCCLAHREGLAHPLVDAERGELRRVAGAQRSALVARQVEALQSSLRI